MNYQLIETGMLMGTSIWNSKIYWYTDNVVLDDEWLYYDDTLCMWDDIRIISIYELKYETSIQ